MRAAWRRLAPALAVTAALGLAVGAAWRLAPRGAASATSNQAPTRDPRGAAMVTLRAPPLAPLPPPARAPNLVLVIGCTVRKDQTSVYGPNGVDPGGTTPFLASIAVEGGRFADIVTAAPWTRAASTAILTGHHPISVGMADPRPSRDDKALADRVVTLADHLRANGVATAGLTTNPNLSDVYGFDQGFDVYRQPAHLWKEVGTKLSGARAVPEAVALLDALPDDRPFFLEVVLIDAHAPFTVDDDEAARFADPSLPEEVVRYRASLHRVDVAVEALDEALRARGHGPDDTVFAFTNDHGDGLGWPASHGTSHGRFLAPSSVGGVFVVRGPGIAPGVVVGGVASQVDIAQTLVGLLGLPAFPGDGIDASAALRGDAPPSVPRDRAFTETWFKEVDRAAVYTGTTACQLDLAPPDADAAAAVVRARNPLARVPFVDGCFDRVHDPLHTAAPFDDAALEEELRAWRAARLGDAAAFGDVSDARPDADTRAHLEALGYVE